MTREPNWQIEKILLVIVGLRLRGKNVVEISARRASKRKNLLGYQEEGWFVGS